MSYVQRTKADLDLLIKQYNRRLEHLRNEIEGKEIEINKLIPLLMQAVKERKGV